MGVSNSSDIFQQKINDVFHGFDFIRTHIYDLFMSTKVDWKDHVQNLELTVNKMMGKGLNCNIEELFFGKTEM